MCVCVWVRCCCCAAVTSAGWPPCVCRVTDEVSHGVFGIPLIHTEKTERRRRKDDILLRRAWETSQVSDRRRRCRRRRRFFVGLAPSSDDSFETLKERETTMEGRNNKKKGGNNRKKTKQPVSTVEFDWLFNVTVSKYPGGLLLLCLIDRMRVCVDLLCVLRP